MIIALQHYRIIAILSVQNNRQMLLFPDVRLLSSVIVRWDYRPNFDNLSNHTSGLNAADVII